MRRIIIAIVAAFLVLTSVKSRAADTFSATLPAFPAAGSFVTMGDPTDVLSFTITNGAGSQNNIKTIFFNIDTTKYNFSVTTQTTSSCALTLQPSAPPNCGLPGCIFFQNNTGIAPGSSCTFNLTLTGPNGGQIQSSTLDQTDGLISIIASKQPNNNQTNDFTLIGSLPAWARKSLAASLTATPSSLGTGGAITLTMALANRSTATQAGITASPDPPSTTGVPVTAVGSAVYGSTSSTVNPAPATLSSTMNSSMTSVPVASTSGFPSSGRVLVDSELLDYTGKTSVTLTGATRGAGGTAAVSHTAGAVVYSQNTSSFTLQSGEASNIAWMFGAGSAGTVYFTTAASNGSASSGPVNSNIVTIGGFTAEVSMTPLSLISGQSATITMTVNNNGSVAFTNVTPSISPLGSATTKTLVSGPTPSSIPTLAPGEKGTFQWTYTISGSIGQTYYFSGSATAGGGNTNTATSQTGSIGQYSVTVNPSTVSTGSSGGTFTWTVYNGGANGIKSVQISIPSPLTSACASSKGWGYVSSAAPANWSVSTSGAPVNSVTFSTTTSNIATGASKSFSITFNCVPQVTSDTGYNFPAVLIDTNNVNTTVNTTITVTADQLTLAAYDSDCSSAAPASKPADGASQYCLKASLQFGGNPVAGKTLSFAVTSGAGTLGASSGVTDSTGGVTVKLTAPCSTSTVNTNVTATLSGDPGVTAALSPPLQFTAITTDLAYVPGSLSPQSVNNGYSSGFTLSLMNCGNSQLVIQTSNSTLADQVGNSFTLASSVTINAGASGTLSFSGTVTSNASNCYALLTVNAGSGYTGPFSYYKNPSGDYLTDSLIVNSGTYCPEVIRIIEWREFR